MSVNEKSNIRSVIRNSARMYFAPVVAVINTMRRDENNSVEENIISTLHTHTGAVTLPILSNTKSFKGNIWALKAKPSTTLANPIEISYLSKPIHQK